MQRCFISFVKISPLVPGKKFFSVFTIYGSHLGHVTSIMLINLISLFLKNYKQNLVENGPLVSEESKFFIFINK